MKITNNLLNNQNYILWNHTKGMMRFWWKFSHNNFIGIKKIFWAHTLFICLFFMSFFYSFLVPFLFLYPFLLIYFIFSNNLEKWKYFFVQLNINNREIPKEFEIYNNKMKIIKFGSTKNFNTIKYFTLEKKNLR